jgi:hypothetical protein
MVLTLFHILVDLGKQVFLCFLSGLVIIAIIVYATLVQVQVLFLMSFTEKSCVKLVLVNWKISMWLFSLLTERLSLQLVLLEMWKFYAVRLNILLIF